MGGDTNNTTAAEKLHAAMQLLTAAFEDTRLDEITLTKHDLLQQTVAAQQVLNTAWAIQSARLAQAAAVEETVIPDHDEADGSRTRQVRHAIGAHQDEYIGCEVGPLLGWTPGYAVHRVAEASDAITRTPRLFRQVAAGRLEPAKLSTIHRALGRVSTVNDDGDPITLDLARQIETALLGADPDDPATRAGLTHAQAVAVEDANIDLLARQSTRQVQHRTHKALVALDPVAGGNAATRRRRDRIGVYTHPDDEPGLCHLHAILPSTAAAKIMAAVDDLARHLHADTTTTTKTLAECRADALTDLILNNAQVTTNLLIQIPIHTRTGATNGTTTDSGTDRTAEGTAFQPPATGTGSAVPGSAAGGGCAPGWPAAFAHPFHRRTTVTTAVVRGRC
ncbi:DUF222 domain-containing protein [Flexivirga oryzae]|uniref:DUF222 domain-containing protein n=1 Tax=Flexivirga oryzae TaxID=1794944 RepID=A0A839N2B3_9MICO|nr:hypothetical protein [Flexivirga oryzae]MBB2891477.1 hypothetical protein [Flexivirga oryzae]